MRFVLFIFFFIVLLTFTIEYTTPASGALLINFFWVPVGTAFLIFLYWPNLSTHRRSTPHWIPVFNLLGVSWLGLYFGLGRLVHEWEAWVVSSAGRLVGWTPLLFTLTFTLCYTLGFIKNGKGDEC